MGMLLRRHRDGEKGTTPVVPETPVKEENATSSNMELVEEVPVISEEETTEEVAEKPKRRYTRRKVKEE